MNTLKFINIRYLIAIIIFATISGWLSYYIYLTSSSLYLEAEHSITQLQKKRKAVAGMSWAARERSLLLFNIYIEQDVFKRDDLKLKMTTLAHHFNTNMLSFEKANLSDAEKTIFDKVIKMVKANAPVHLEAAGLMVSDEMELANKILFGTVIPNQEEVLHEFDEILNLIDVNVRDEIGRLQSLQNLTNKYILELVFLVLSGIFILFFIIYTKTKKRESELKELVVERTQQSEQAHAQMKSLVENSSDGIISIDINHNIVLFNPAAESIFQHKKEDVLGKSLTMLLPDAVHHNHHRHVVTFGDGEESHSRLMTSRSEIQGKRKDGTLFDAEASISKSSVDGDTYFTAFIRDVTDRRKAEEEIRRLAMFDSLTGLANKHYFETLLKEAIAYTSRFPTNKIALFLLDLDFFKKVNDTHGHAVGDALLKRVADTLKEHVREVDVVCRLGGDEFSILLQGIEVHDQAGIVAAKLIAALSELKNIDNHEVECGVSIGITFCPEFGTDSELLFRQADKMMYKSKEAGRNTYRIYTGQDINSDS